MNLNAGSLGGVFPRLDSNRLEVISLLINDKCNLNCRHCYLAGYNDESMSIGEWMKVCTGIFKDLSPSILCIAGKEPFFNIQSVELWSSIIELRNQFQPPTSRNTKIGLITNGMNIDRFYETLLQYPPDYLDVSVDGKPEVHDQIRGVGSFDSLKPNLLWLSKNLPERIWITHTLFNNNINEFPAFIKFFVSEYRISQFAIGLFRESTFSDNYLSLGGDISRIVNTFKSLKDIVFGKPITMVLELGFDQLPAIMAFMKLSDRNSLETWGTISLKLSDCLTLQVNYSTIPTGLWHSVRISASGHWLSAEDMLFPLDYNNRAVINLHDCAFDVYKAYDHGLKKVKVFHKSIVPHLININSKSTPIEQFTI